MFNDYSILLDVHVIGNVVPGVSADIDHSSETADAIIMSTVQGTPRQDLSTFESLLPVPKSASRCNSAPGVGGARKRKVGHAQVITASPYKNLLEELSSRRPKGKIQKKESVGRKRQTSQKPKAATRLQLPTEEEQEEDRTLCIYCEIAYCKSKVSWICCRRCKRWACNDCVVLGKKKSFICSECS